IDHIDSWVALFSESLPGPVTRLVKVAEVKRRDQNIAGISLPFLDSVTYEILPYSRKSTPLWVDCGVEIVKELMELREKAKVMQDAEKVLQHELRKVTQRLNLFEKVKIPQSQEAIRVIRIALADEQTAGVGRAKIAKAKTLAEPTTEVSS
ncbi:MAG TPA: V-type ATP synthase subunit D, partial [Candidatus Ozemobacteraceae bacterium]|nr:V-type ATP synthase subunit D [Candidatus Ozemobacteraceae bacterium]